MATKHVREEEIIKLSNILIEKKWELKNLEASIKFNEDQLKIMLLDRSKEFDKFINVNKSDIFIKLLRLVQNYRYKRTDTFDINSINFNSNLGFEININANPENFTLYYSWETRRFETYNKSHSIIDQAIGLANYLSVDIQDMFLKD